jgi:hypothetical protein
MRFCPWYPLADAAAHAPSSRGVLQIRVADGLLDYPSGKSAMLHYELTDDVRAAALRYQPAQPGLLCRHTIEMTDADAGSLDTFHERLLRDFRARFGDLPRPAR